MSSPNLGAYPLHLKLEHVAVVKRRHGRVSDYNSFEKLSNTTLQAFSTLHPPLTFLYRDSDGDLITVDSEEGYQAVLSLETKYKLGSSMSIGSMSKPFLLRLTVQGGRPPSTTSPAAATAASVPEPEPTPAPTPAPAAPPSPPRARNMGNPATNVVNMIEHLLTDRSTHNASQIAQAVTSTMIPLALNAIRAAGSPHPTPSRSSTSTSASASPDPPSRSQSTEFEQQASAEDGNESPEPAPAATPVPENPQSQVVHPHVRCDNCGVCPIVGDRYKCAVREDFDLCSACEAKEGSDAPFPYLKIKRPSQAPAALICVLRGNEGSNEGLEILSPNHPARRLHRCRRNARRASAAAAAQSAQEKEKEEEASPAAAASSEPAAAAEAVDELIKEQQEEQALAAKIAAQAEAAAPSESSSEVTTATTEASEEAVEEQKESEPLVEEMEEQVKEPEEQAQEERAPAPVAEVVNEETNASSPSILSASLVSLARSFVSNETKPLDVQLCEDCNIPDNTLVAPNASLVKEWLLKNNGTQTIPQEGTTLVIIEGEGWTLRGGAVVTAETPAGGYLVVAGDLLAPSTPGDAAASFRLSTESGELFGDIMKIKVVVDPMGVKCLPEPEEWTLVDSKDQKDVQEASSSSVSVEPCAPPAEAEKPLDPLLVWEGEIAHLQEIMGKNCPPASVLIPLFEKHIQEPGREGLGLVVHELLSNM